MREIVSRSLAVAGSEGIDALTIGRLAAELDYTPGALYRYFPSKDVLVAELQRTVVVYLGDALERTTANVNEHATGNGLDELERTILAIAAAALAFADFGRRMPAAFGFLSMYLSDPEYRLSAGDARYVHSATRETLAVLARLYEQAATSGAISAGDGAVRALTSWAALQGVMQTRKLARNDERMPEVDSLVRGLIRTLLIGWGADAERADRAIDRTLQHRLDVFPGSIEEYLQVSERGEAAIVRNRARAS